MNQNFLNVDSDDDWLIDINEYLDQLFQQQQQQNRKPTKFISTVMMAWIDNNSIIIKNNFINQSNEILNFNRMGFQFNYIDIFIIPFIQRILEN